MKTPMNEIVQQIMFMFLTRWHITQGYHLANMFKETYNSKQFVFRIMIGHPQLTEMQISLVTAEVV